MPFNGGDASAAIVPRTHCVGLRPNKSHSGIAGLGVGRDRWIIVLFCQLVDPDHAADRQEQYDYADPLRNR